MVREDYGVGDEVFPTDGSAGKATIASAVADAVGDDVAVAVEPTDALVVGAALASAVTASTVVPAAAKVASSDGAGSCFEGRVGAALGSEFAATTVVSAETGFPKESV